MKARHKRPILGLGLLAASLLGTACDSEGTTEPPPGSCPAELPSATLTCTDPSCQATTGTKTFSQAELTADAGKSWVVVSWATSELFDNENPDIIYHRSTPGGLTAARRGERARVPLEERLSAEDFDRLYGPARASNLAAERLIRAQTPTDPVDLSGVSGTGIRGRTAELLPPGVKRQDMACSQAAPGCGPTALCVIPSGSTAGVCESTLAIKWRDQSRPAMFEEVNATVRKVGTHGAIVVDDETTMADADVDELLRRFDEHIAPLDHAFFGEPKNSQGRDRDGNGVVILFFTHRVGELGDNFAGFFQATDLRDPAQNPESNGADLLYMREPGPRVSMHQLSGTLAHEYEHLINYYAKVVNRMSSQETVWLDEGLATFAEDVVGYGADSFKNVGAYLTNASDTSLTGSGLVSADPDSAERRGMAHLLVRYVFEQRGGASFGAGPGQVEDAGGVAAVRALVQSAETGVDLFGTAKNGRSFGRWIADLLITVAVDGANYKDVSCNPKYSFRAPETAAYTEYPRGLGLRTPAPDPAGGTIRLNGPATATFEAEEVPVAVNGGEIRTLALPSGTTRIGIGGPAEDYDIGFIAIPVDR